MEQAPTLRKDISAVQLDDVAFEFECSIALVAIVGDSIQSGRFTRDDYSNALNTAVECLYSAYKHLKDQIYTNTPAGSPESTLPQNDPQGVPV